MGWAFEYLQEDLIAAIQVKFDYPIEVRLDNNLYKLLHYGDGEPETGSHTGVVMLGEGMKPHEATFVIKRKMPDDGIEYGPYEPSYEVVLDKMKSL